MSEGERERKKCDQYCMYGVVNQRSLNVITIGYDCWLLQLLLRSLCSQISIIVNTVHG